MQRRRSNQTESHSSPQCVKLKEGKIDVSGLEEGIKMERKQKGERGRMMRRAGIDEGDQGRDE